MNVKDIVGRKSASSRQRVLRIEPGVSLGEAAKILADNKIGLVVVCAEDGAMMGVLSERDIVRAIGAKGAPALDDQVAEHMTRKVQTCKLADHPFDVMDMMTAGNFRHVPVVDNGALKGVISTRDIFKYITEHASPQEQAVFFTKIAWA